MGTTIENKNKKKYVEPSLWVDSYTIERGFSASLALDWTFNEEGYRAVESREMSNGYFGGSDTWF